MVQHEEIVLWLDRRWKNAIEKHLKGETLQEHLETVLDELCNRLPEREYEDAAPRSGEWYARLWKSEHPGCPVRSLQSDTKRLSRRRKLLRRQSRPSQRR